jgi:RecB family exonuclease
MRGSGQDARQDAGRTRRLSVPQAAEALGTSEGALRKRIARGTVQHERDGEGRVWVYVASNERVDGGQDAGQDTGQPDRTDLLIAELQDRVRSLQDIHTEYSKRRRRAQRGPSAGAGGVGYSGRDRGA